MFSILACKTKMNAPRCHTFLEIIQVRYGSLAHCVFIFFALVTNILVGSQLLLGGSAVVTTLTGMNVYAAIFLIPLGVVAYVSLPRSLSWIAVDTVWLGLDGRSPCYLFM
jgi:Na+/proline symporter